MDNVLENTEPAPSPQPADKIELAAGTASQTIKVTQKQKDAIILAESEYIFEPDG